MVAGIKKEDLRLLIKMKTKFLRAEARLLQREHKFNYLKALILQEKNTFASLGESV